MNSPPDNIEYPVPEGEVLVSKTDLNGNITYCNNTLIEVSGYSREELLCSPHNLLRHPDMPKQVFADLWKTIQANKPWRGLIKNRRKDGRYYWVESHITPLIENGTTIGYVSFHYSGTVEQIRHIEDAYRTVRTTTGKFRLHEGKVMPIENRLVRWLNASSIKFRLVAFMSFLFSILLMLGVYNLHQAANTHQSAIASLEVTRLQAYALDTARLAEMDFQTQMQSWKSAPIDAKSDQRLMDYEQQGATFRKRLGLLKSLMKEIDLPASEIDKALQSHDELTRILHTVSAYRSVLSFGGETKNAELATTAHIEMAISAIQDAQQNRLQALNVELDQSHQTDDKRAIAMLTVAGLVGLFLSMRFVIYVMHPIRSTHSKLKKVVKLQQYFLSIILKLEVYRDRIDEEQRVGNFIMSQMTDMPEQLDASIQRYLKPADHLSGDILIASVTPDNIVHILLADAVGHGLTAAINVLPLCQTFYDMTHKGFAIERIATDLNEMIHRFMPVDRFVAAALISIDRDRQLIEVWNGGIPAPLLFGRNGKLLHSWNSQHLPLGLASGTEFSSTPETFHYQDHCQLCLYSDGLTEATSADGRHFGHQRIVELFGKTLHPARFDTLIEALGLHLLGHPAHDDISLAVVNIEAGVTASALSREDQGLQASALAA